MTPAAPRRAAPVARRRFSSPDRRAVPRETIGDIAPYSRRGCDGNERAPDPSHRVAFDCAQREAGSAVELRILATADDGGPRWALETAPEEAELLPIGPPAVGASNGHGVLGPDARPTISRPRRRERSAYASCTGSRSRTTASRYDPTQRAAGRRIRRPSQPAGPPTVRRRDAVARRDAGQGDGQSPVGTWRLRQAGAEIIESTGDYLSLGPDVAVDVLDFVVWSRRLITELDIVTTARIEDVTVAGDLLPDWYDDWVVIERERLRQLRLHALERACLFSRWPANTVARSRRAWRPSPRSRFTRAVTSP